MIQSALQRFFHIGQELTHHLSRCKKRMESSLSHSRLLGQALNPFRTKISFYFHLQKRHNDPLKFFVNSTFEVEWTSPVETMLRILTKYFSVKNNPPKAAQGRLLILHAEASFECRFCELRDQVSIFFFLLFRLK